MTDKVNGAVHAGQFLTGVPNFFSFATLVPVGQTNVTAEVVDLAGYQTLLTLGVWTNVTVNDAFGNANTYTSLSSYLDAYYQQLNLNRLIEIFATRANPVSISVKTFPASVNGGTVNPHTSTIFSQMGYSSATGATVFGSNFNGTGLTVYIVNIATEHSLLWTAGSVGNFTGTPADNSNNNGYSILGNNALYGGLDASVAYDLNTAQVIGGSQAFTGASTNYYTVKNTLTPFLSTWDASTSAGTNVLASQNFFIGGSLLA